MIRGEWLTMTEAQDITGYTDGYLRRLLREGTLKGQKFGARLWLITKESAERLRDTEQLTGRPRSRPVKKKKIR